MTMIYSNPFYIRDASERTSSNSTSYVWSDNWPDDNPAGTPEGEQHPQGWYWQVCFPGCMPDGELAGPFGTEQEAIDDARFSAAAGMDDYDGATTIGTPNAGPFGLPPCVIAVGGGK